MSTAPRSANDAEQRMPPGVPGEPATGRSPAPDGKHLVVEVAPPAR